MATTPLPAGRHRAEARGEDDELARYNAFLAEANRRDQDRRGGRRP